MSSDDVLFRADLLFEVCHVFADGMVTLLEADPLVFHGLLLEELHELAAEDLLDQFLGLTGDGLLALFLDLLEFGVVEVSGDRCFGKVQNLSSEVVDCQVVGQSPDQRMLRLVWVNFVFLPGLREWPSSSQQPDDPIAVATSL